MDGTFHFKQNTEQKITMNIILNAEPFLISFNLDEKVKSSENTDIYKFSFFFSHYCNEEIKFVLPKRFQAYLYSSDIIRLIKVLTEKVEQLTRSTDRENVDIKFERNCFVSYEHDIEIIVDTGEYYPEFSEGVLELLILFNINVAYKESGSSMIGLRERVDLNSLNKFIEDLKGLNDVLYSQ